MRGGRSVALIGLLLAVSSLSACSVTRQSPHSGSTTTGSVAPSASASVGSPSPEGSTTPAAAVRLKLGQSTTREWSPKQGVAGRIRLRVTDVAQADWSYFKGWQVSPQTRHTTRPFFVRATIVNVGKPNLGGFRVPLYALDAANQLVEPSTFGSATGNTAFHWCHPDTLPQTFPRGRRAASCLVMLVPKGSAMVGASFRPQQDVQPVTWEATPRKLPPQKGTAAS